MEDITKFVFDYLIKNTNESKKIINRDLDSIVQLQFNCHPLSEGRVRGIIHEIRTQMPILREDGVTGWVCGDSEGYYVSYNPYRILEHLNQFNGKIMKMQLVYRKGMQVLSDKIFYKQLELFHQD